MEKGFILINKPEGWTSFDAVGFIRNKIRQTSPPLTPPQKGGGIFSPSQAEVEKKPNRIKVGHAGTLDPFATGLLIIGVGREATKRLDEFKNLPKTYLATILLGETSVTDDKTGETTKISDTIPTKSEIKKILAIFVGKQNQIPPMYSAKKIDGQRLYKLARKGEIIKRQPSEIEIYSLKLKNYNYPELEIEVTCSAGTYIRTLARDIGEKLKTGAYCKELCRTSIGDHKLETALNPSAPELEKVLTALK